MRPARWRRAAGRALALLALGLTAGIFFWLTRAPSHDRDWKGEYARLAHVAFGPDGAVTIDNLRDFRWGPGPAALDEAWRTGHYQMGHLQGVWYGLSDFHPIGLAHAFLSFDFGRDGFVTLSAEARQEVGEHYSIWGGLTRRLELALLLGTEPDIIGLRTHWRHQKVRLYPLRLGPGQTADLFHRVAQRVNALAGQPEFYNTLTTNCTSLLVENDPRIGSFRRKLDRRLLLNSDSDLLARELGLIDTGLPVAAQRAAATIDPAPCPPERDDFSACIRAQAPPSGLR